jgi:hypothetical protein
LQLDNTCKKELIESSNKRAKVEENHNLDIQLCLRDANEEPDVPNEQRGKAIDKVNM